MTSYFIVYTIGDGPSQFVGAYLTLADARVSVARAGDHDGIRFLEDWRVKAGLTRSAPVTILEVRWTWRGLKIAFHDGRA